jgi:hypothetical protein
MANCSFRSYADPAVSREIFNNESLGIKPYNDNILVPKMLAHELDVNGHPVFDPYNFVRNNFETQLNPDGVHQAIPAGEEAFVAHFARVAKSLIVDNAKPTPIVRRLGDNESPAVAPTMAANTTRTITAGATALPTDSATAGDEPIVYSLTGANTSLFNIVSGTGIITFKAAAVAGTYVINKVATNATGSASQTYTITVTAASVDTTPDAFNLGAPVTNANVSTASESGTITVSGVTASTNVPISITGSGGSSYQYAVNTGSGFGAFTSSSGNVQLGHQVKVRLTSSGSNSTAASATLNIGGVTSSFAVTTKAAASNTPDSLFFTTVGENSNIVTISGLLSPAPVTIVGGQYKKNGGAFTSSAGTVVNGDTLQLSSDGGASVTVTVGGSSFFWIVSGSDGIARGRGMFGRAL